jgi:membrane fusion protein (multidrug efflux system)
MPTDVDVIEQLRSEEAKQPETHHVSLRERLANPRFRALVVLAGVFLIAACVAGFVYYGGRESTDDAQVDGDIDPIASKVYGSISRVLIDDNQAVKAGQVVVRIDARDYQAKVDQARAALEVAEAQAKAAATGVPLTAETTTSATSGSEAKVAAREAEYERSRVAFEQAAGAGLAYAKANVDARQAADERAGSDLRRMKPLAAREEISQQELDAYAATSRVAHSELQAAGEKLQAALKDVDIRKNAMLNAKAGLEEARAELVRARASEKEVPISSAKAASAKAAVAKAKADLGAVELQLSYCDITAPMDGVVTRKSVEPGEIVQPGQQLFILVPLDRVWVNANFKETQLAHVRAGQRAEIDIDMYGKTLAGHVDSIAGATGARSSLLPPENATGNFVKVVQRIPVKIRVDRNQDFILRPGMNVDATVITH